MWLYIRFWDWRNAFNTVSLKNQRWQKVVGIDVCAHTHKARKWELEQDLTWSSGHEDPEHSAVQPTRANAAFYNESWDCHLCSKVKTLSSPAVFPTPCVAYKNHWPPLNTYINPCFYLPWSLLHRIARVRSSETPPTEHVSFRPSLCSS